MNNLLYWLKLLGLFNRSSNYYVLKAHLVLRAVGFQHLSTFLSQLNTSGWDIMILFHFLKGFVYLFWQKTDKEGERDRERCPMIPFHS